MRKLLAAAGAVLVVLGGAAMKAADQATPAVKTVIRGIDETRTAIKKVPSPVKQEIKKALRQMAKEEAEDVIWASCRVKDSSNIEQQASRDYWDRSQYKIDLIVKLAKVMHAEPEVGALCSQIL